MIDPTKTIFSTRYNFQKIYDDDEVTLSIANIVSLTNYTLVTHDLGYVPTVRVFYEPVSGQLWPLSRNQYGNFAGGSGTTLFVTGTVFATSTQIRVAISNGSGSSQSIKFAYRIYLDE